MRAPTISPTVSGAVSVSNFPAVPTTEILKTDTDASGPGDSVQLFSGDVSAYREVTVYLRSANNANLYPNEHCTASTDDTSLGTLTITSSTSSIRARLSFRRTPLIRRRPI
jgi:hypothetical protein